MDDTDRWKSFKRRTLFGIAAVTTTVVALAAFWKLYHLLLLIFAALLLAVFLDGIARWLSDKTPMPRQLSLALACLAIAGGLFAFWWWVGPNVVDQFEGLEKKVPEATAQVRDWMSQSTTGQKLLKRMPEPGDWLAREGVAALGSLRGFFTSAMGLFSAFAFILIAGLYMAIEPRAYLKGGRALVPPRHRDRADAVVHQLGFTLRRWFMGRFASMTAVGVLTTLGLWLLDVPLALGLGFIAGVLSFVPFLGPIVSAIPALLIGLLEGPSTAAYVALLYAGIQFVEGNLITPLIQRRAVSMPPALLVLGQLALGTIAGLLGVLLATPLLVSAIVLVQMLYVEDVLDDEVELLGEAG